MAFTKRNKIITTVSVLVLLAGGTGYVVYQHDVQAKELKAEQVQKAKEAKEADAKDAKLAKDVSSKLAKTDRGHLNALKEEAKKVKDPARKSNLDKAIKEATVRLDKADKVAAEKKAEEARKAAQAQAAAEAAAAEQAAKEQAAAQAQAAAKPAANAETAASAQASAPAQQASPAPETAPAATATPSAPSYSIAGYSSVAIANSQAFIDNSRYSWISLSDVPTAGGIALLGHADAAGAWVAGANVGDIVTVSGVSYKIYNKYTVGWNSPGEWDAIQSCGSGEVSIITCTDASGQSDWVLRAKRV